MTDVKLHDFEKSKKYNPSQIRFLTTYSDAFLKSSNMQLQYELKNQSSMRMVLKEAYQESYGNFLEKMEYETVILDFDIGDKAKNLILNLDKKVALIIIDCLLGSNGQVSTNKALTDIDIEILKYICNLLFKKTTDSMDMEDAYINDVYANKVQYRNPNTNGTIYISVFEVYLGTEVIGNMRLCIPYESVEKVIDLMMSQQKNNKDSVGLEKDAINQEILESMFDNKVELDVVAELGSATISVKELLDMEPGDAFMLDRKISEDIDVLVGGKRSYTAKPGRVGSNNAVVITGTIEGEDVENDEREN